MISATTGTQHPNAASILLNTTTPSVSSSSFTQQLADALQQYLDKSGSGANLEIDIKPSQSQSSGASQFLVTVTAAPPAAATIASVAAPTPALTRSFSPILDTRATAPLIGASAAESGATLTPVEPGQTTPADGNPPLGYEDVPFGNSFTAMPTLATELAESNRVNAMMAQINPDSLSTTLAQAGDPMYGTSVPGSSMQWNDLTENQQLAYQHACLSGVPQGQTMDQFLAANVGPSAWWNASYASPNMFGPPPAPGSVNMHTNGYTVANG